MTHIFPLTPTLYSLSLSLSLSFCVEMAALSSLSLSGIIGQSSGRKVSISSSRRLAFNAENFRIRTNSPCYSVNTVSRFVTRCLSASSDGVAPTVADTKLNFLKAYKRPIPSIYNTVLQELIVQHHLMKYKRTFCYDPVFALGFVTVYDQLIDGYPSDEDREAIFQAYIKALQEEPEQYQTDAQKFEEWARSQTSSSLVEFSSKDGEVEGIMKDIAERSGSGSFSYTRFFAIGLFRVLELANASEPTILEKLCASLNINKKNVDRDLDVYRNQLSKMVQAKELLREYVDREKKKVQERSDSLKAGEAVTKCLGDYQYLAQ